MSQVLAFGSYLLNLETREVAVVISSDKQHKRGFCDLLYENGSTLFDQQNDKIMRDYHYLFNDPHLVIDGCSTNPGWSQAHQLKNEFLREK